MTSSIFCAYIKCYYKMASLYIVVDQFGLIAGFNDINKAYILIECYPKISLMVVEYPMDKTAQKEEFYFLPYINNNAIALASNNKKYVLNIKRQLLSVGLTYPDSLDFYTREMNKIHELELKRLLHPEIQSDTDAMMNLADLSGADPVDSGSNPGLMVGGMHHEQYNILDKVYGAVCEKETAKVMDCSDTRPELPEDNVDTIPA